MIETFKEREQKQKKENIANSDISPKPFDGNDEKEIADMIKGIFEATLDIGEPAKYSDIMYILTNSIVVPKNQVDNKVTIIQVIETINRILKSAFSDYDNLIIVPKLSVDKDTQTVLSNDFLIYRKQDL